MPRAERLPERCDATVWRPGVEVEGIRIVPLEHSKGHAIVHCSHREAVIASGDVILQFQEEGNERVEVLKRAEFRARWRFCDGGEDDDFDPYFREGPVG